MQRTFYTTASLLAMLSVMLGAFAAHALKERLTPELLQVFETGVRYQFYHSFALFITGYFSMNYKSARWAGRFFIAGVLLFSGSVYLLSVRDLIGLENYKWLGPVTPIGGLCFITGWLLLGIGFLRGK